MSKSKKQQLNKIDMKVGRISGQFNDIQREMMRLLHRELDAQELIDDMAALLKDCYASIESEFPNSRTLDTITEMLERVNEFKGDQ